MSPKTPLQLHSFAELAAMHVAALERRRVFQSLSWLWFAKQTELADYGDFRSIERALKGCI